MKLDFGPVSKDDYQEISLVSFDDLVKKKPERKSSVRKMTEPIIMRKVSISEANLALSFPNDDLNITQEISVDTETTGLVYWGNDEAWMVSMCDEDGNSFCTYWPVDPYTRKVHVIKNAAYYYLKGIVENPNITKSYWNAKYDIRMLEKAGIIHAGPFKDCALQARIYKTDEMAYKLKPLSRKYLGLVYDDEKDLKEITKRLRAKAKKWGFKIFSNEDTTKKSDDKSAPDYWLIAYAHILLDDEEEAEKARALAEEYCRKDTARTIALSMFYTEKIEADEAYLAAYNREVELFYLVMEMEALGIRTFKSTAEDEKFKCEDEAGKLLEKIRKVTGNPNFNPDSSQDKSNFLYYSPNGPKIPVTNKTDLGQPKCDYKTLSEYTYLEIVRDLFRVNALTKANSLFFNKYLANIKELADGNFIIHPEINQSNTKTFRFSYSNPNLQQAANPETSARGADVIQVRNCFGPRPGYNWWLYDYSGQELRLLGGLMQINEILDAVANGRDIPTELGNRSWGGRNKPAAIAQVIESLELQNLEPSTPAVALFWKKEGFVPGTRRQEELNLIADQIFSRYDYNIVKLEKAVDKKTVRTRTKMCLYGKAYGAGPSGVAALLRVNKGLASQWLAQLDKDFPRMKRVANSWAAQGARDGFITNAYGRKLSVDPSFAYRATNYRIQGSAAEMMKIAMLQCNTYLKKTGLDARIILTVHDELIFEIKQEHSYKWLLRGLKTIMEDHEKYIGIPMEVGISKVMYSWDKEQEIHLEAA
jgi:DNA polymerase I-like protein with 3'-5' exonuclease and polymerase domains